jgi:hypothetical protein
MWYICAKCNSKAGKFHIYNDSSSIKDVSGLTFNCCSCGRNNTFEQIADKTDKLLNKNLEKMMKDGNS